MKDFLIEMFDINRDANIKMVSAIKKIGEQDEILKLHHRAQIQMMIRAQDHRPGFIDYIGYKQNKTGQSASD